MLLVKHPWVAINHAIIIDTLQEGNYKIIIITWISLYIQQDTKSSKLYDNIMEQFGPMKQKLMQTEVVKIILLVYSVYHKYYWGSLKNKA